jgi:hypothetical protein
MESAGSSEDSPVNLTAASTSSQTNSNSAPPIPKGHGRILRDADGTVLGIELADEDEEMAQDDDREKDMEETAPEVDAYVREKWITGLGGGPKGNGDGNVVEGEPDQTHAFHTSFFQRAMVCLSAVRWSRWSSCILHYLPNLAMALAVLRARF